MIFFLMILLLIIFNRARFAGENQFMTDYMSIEKTNAVKGIFVILVIFSHWAQYVKLSGVYDEPYLLLKSHLGQMIVAMFLFYSGYGMLEAVKRKGIDYIKKIPTQRLITVLVNFDIAVILFLILKTAMGIKYDLKTILWSLVGWKSLGNSNWYIFVMICLYIIFFVTFFIGMTLFRGQRGVFAGTVLFTIGTVGYVFLLMKMNMQGYWYNTAILFPLGCGYSLFHKNIESVVMRNDYIYGTISLLILTVYVAAFKYRGTGGIEAYTVWAVAFTMMIVFATMKVGIQNEVLNWFGKHTFSVYILQRLPMIVLSQFSYFTEHKYMYLMLSIVSTCVMASIFDYYTGKLVKFLRIK